MPSLRADIFKFYLDSGGTVTVYESAFEADIFALDKAFLTLCENNGPGHFKINDEGPSRDICPVTQTRPVSESSCPYAAQGWLLGI